MNKPLNSNSFNALYIVLAILLSIAIGAAVWRVYHEQNKQVTTGSAQSQDTAINNGSAVRYKQFKDTLLGYRISYPANWNISTSQNTQNDVSTAETSITSPNGTTLTLREDYGGKGGGDCENAVNETPFARENTCNSSEFTKLTPLKTYTYDENGDRVPFQLARFSYSPGNVDKAGPTVYASCLVADTDTSFPLVAGKAQMGGFFYPPFVTLFNKDGQTLQDKPFYLYACASSPSADLYDSADGKVIETTLKSFRYVGSDS